MHRSKATQLLNEFLSRKRTEIEKAAYFVSTKRRVRKGTCTKSIEVKGLENKFVLP